ncbi:MAG: D-alanyl-D-alanine dipeptidase [Azospirillum sp.]|nr:D-alanyl-D-alanine dipeptidase [Azospirillum sp.]
MTLVQIAPPAFDIDLDLRYATADNFTGAVIYRQPICLLHPQAAAKLAHAVGLARMVGLRLRVFDGYRPVEAQWRLWRALPDPMFVADPGVGSPHGRGIAIDLTLADAEGRALDMGTGFDDMTPRSHHARTDIPIAAQRHRFLLLGLMAAAGWQHYPYEWWHYQLPDAEHYPPVADGSAGQRLVD